MRATCGWCLLVPILGGCGRPPSVVPPAAVAARSQLSVVLAAWDDNLVPARPVSRTVELPGAATHIVLAQALAEAADPDLRVLDARGAVLGESTEFRNANHAAAVVRTDEPRSVTVELTCPEDKFGRVRVQIVRAGRLTIGANVVVELPDEHAWRWFELPAVDQNRRQVLACEPPATASRLLVCLAGEAGLDQEDLALPYRREGRAGRLMVGITAAEPRGLPAFRLRLKDTPVQPTRPDA